MGRFQLWQSTYQFGGAEWISGLEFFKKASGEFRIFILILFKVPQKEENWSSLVVCFLLVVVCWLFLSGARGVKTASFLAWVGLDVIFGKMLRLSPFGVII